MSRSGHNPEQILSVKDKLYLRNNINQITETDEMTNKESTFYEYDEIVVQGYTQDFISNRIQDVFNNPQKYNVIQSNGRTIKNPKGIEFAKVQEEELQDLENSLGQLILDNLNMTEAINTLILDSLEGV